MTMLTLNSNQLETLSLDFQSSSSQATSSPGRFNLRKRSVQPEKPNLSSYNSDFLSGLFADVAKVQVTEPENSSQAEQEPPVPQTETVQQEKDHSDPRLDVTLSVKKSRTSLTKSVSRCGRSFGNLALTHLLSPVAVSLFEDPAMPSPASTSELGQSSSMKRMDSLHFQLGCVGDSPKSIKSVVDIVGMAFPHLPPTVSDSSCLKQGDLTQKSVCAVPDCETSASSSTDDSTASGDGKKESYGWFVDMDDDDENDHTTADPYANGNATSDLAFQAPTAPKRKSSHQAEVEWAKAADTVDDVLGDFF